MIKKKLNGGVFLTYLPGDKFKTAYIRMNLYRPMGEESAKNALLARVLKAGSKKYTKLELEKELEALYGAALGATVSKIGDVQVMSFSIALPGDRYTGNGTVKKAAELLKEIITNPDVTDGEFNKDTVDVEKKNLENLILSSFNDKKEYAEQRCIEIMFEGQPFAIGEYGRLEDVKKLDGKCLKEHYDSIFANSRIDIYVSGECDIDSVCSVFEGLKSCGDIPENKVKNEKREVKTVVESQDVNQGKLVMGFVTEIEPASDDYYKLLVFNSVFGSGTHSKLFCNVREKLSLAYYAYARLNRNKSVILAGSGIEFENYEKTKDEILFQLDEIKKGNVTDFELASSQKSLINAYKSMEDEPARIISAKTSNALLGVEKSVEEITQLLLAVTKEDVVKMASKVHLDCIYFLKGKEDE